MVKAAVGQLCSNASMTANLQQCQKLIGAAVRAGAQALFLPEASDYVASAPAETVSLALPASRSPFVLGLQQEARHHGLPIHVGIHEPAEQGRVKNVLVWIDAKGNLSSRYQKLHLFDVDLSDGPTLLESKSTEPGKCIEPPFPSPIGKIASMTCFDMRFPSLSTRLRDLGAEILTYPSAFTIRTGEAGHWHTLLRARAIENQCYVIAAAQVGRHGGLRTSYGHSMIIDPWGKILAEAAGYETSDVHEVEPQIICADIDMEALEKVRREMPLLPRRDLLDVRSR